MCYFVLGGPQGRWNALFEVFPTETESPRASAVQYLTHPLCKCRVSLRGKRGAWGLSGATEITGSAGSEVCGGAYEAQLGKGVLGVNSQEIRM